jgi:K(+)-stimulated pyrophosphate-energized sodium pump
MYSYLLFRKHFSPKVARKRPEIKSDSIDFMDRKYKYISPVLVVLTLLMIISLDNRNTFLNEGFAFAISFVLGATLAVVVSAISLKMPYELLIIGKDNSKTNSSSKAFNSAKITSLVIVSLGLLGIMLLLLMFYYLFRFEYSVIMKTISGFGLGVTTILFLSTLSNFIFNSSLNILNYNKYSFSFISKTEMVGNDIFTSFIASMISSIIIGYLYFNIKGVMFPLVIFSLSILLCLLLDMLALFLKKRYSYSVDINSGFIINFILFIIFSYIISAYLFNDSLLFVPLLIGHLFGILTSMALFNIKSTTVSKTGSLFAAIFVLLMSVTLYFSWVSVGLYGVSLSVVGLLSPLVYISTVAMYRANISSDQISDHANTRKASIFSSALLFSGSTMSSLSLILAFIIFSHTRYFDLLDTTIFLGILLGAIIILLFFVLFDYSTKMIVSRLSKKQLFPPSKASLKHFNFLSKKSFLDMIFIGALIIFMPVIIGIYLGAHVLVWMLISSFIVGMIIVSLRFSSDFFSSSLGDINKKDDMLYSEYYADDIQCFIVNTMLKMIPLVALVFLILFV